MMRLLICAAVFVLLISAPSRADDDAPKALSYVIGDLVSVEKIALAMAEALIRSTYGDDAFESIKPMTVRRDGEFWIIEGKMPRLATVRMRRVDACINRFLISPGPNRLQVEWIGSPNKDDCQADARRAPEKP